MCLSNEQKDAHWNIDEQHLNVSDTAGNSVSIPWTQLLSIKITRKGYLLIRKGCGPLWIAHRTFNDEMSDKFKALFHEKLNSK